MLRCLWLSISMRATSCKETRSKCKAVVYRRILKRLVQDTATYESHKSLPTFSKGLTYTLGISIPSSQTSETGKQGPAHHTCACKVQIHINSMLATEELLTEKLHTHMF